VRQDVQPSPTQRNPPVPAEVDCSSSLRPEEYNAADALLRFHQFHEREARKATARAQSGEFLEEESTTQSTEPTPRSTPSSTFSEKQKKKRTHSKTNISDLVNSPEDPLQAEVRQNLRLACHLSDTVIPDDHIAGAQGRQFKRNRCGEERLSTVDRTRLLLKNKENRPLQSKSNLCSELREAGARYQENCCF
jgi:hypothetical protein